ncbi:MAG: hypothetical protein ACJ8C4_14515 [Gemmataceae bacterium]
MTRHRSTLRLTRLEGRDVPSTTNIFDPQFYLNTYPDVADAVARGEFKSAEEHFRIWGDKELRVGNPLFNPFEYLEDNPDVRAAYQLGVATPMLHFETNGQFEGRNANRSFNTAQYLADNPDVNGLVVAGQVSAFEHFWQHGQFEDRIPSHNFDRADYLADNLDIAMAVNVGQFTAVQHYENLGRYEGRFLQASAPITLTVGQTYTISAYSNNNNDDRIYAFAPPVSGTLTIQIHANNGTPLALATVEATKTSSGVFSTDPGTGIGVGVVTAGNPYLIRVHSPSGAQAQYTMDIILT